MMGGRENFKLLFHQYLENNCSAEELDELMDLLCNGRFKTLANQLLEEKLRAQHENLPEDQGLKDRLQVKLNTILAEGKKKDASNFKRYSIVWRWIAAASIVLALGVGGLLLFQHSQQLTATHQMVVAQLAQDILPGGNKAILTLSNGNTVSLDSVHKGILSKEGGSSVSNMADGLLSYNKAASVAQVVYNTLTTPNGGQYKLQLSDGTMVWLNDASSIHYPTTFTGNERVVEITGEAYFEVAHDAKRPFSVKVNNELIKDIGTHFNVNAYADEKAVKTTLLEGAVSVQFGIDTETSVILQPNQQALVTDNGNIQIKKLDNADNTIAWKNGMFYFDDADIKTLMQQLAKWYDIKVEYEGIMPRRKFKGKIQRNIPLSVVLRNIGEDNIHYRIENKTVTIFP